MSAIRPRRVRFVLGGRTGFPPGRIFLCGHGRIDGHLSVFGPAFSPLGDRDPHGAAPCPPLRPARPLAHRFETSSLSSRSFPPVRVEDEVRPTCARPSASLRPRSSNTTHVARACIFHGAARATAARAWSDRCPGEATGGMTRPAGLARACGSRTTEAEGGEGGRGKATLARNDGVEADAAMSFGVGDFVHAVTGPGSLDILRIEAVQGHKLRGTIFYQATDLPREALPKAMMVEEREVVASDRTVQVAVDTVVRRCAVVGRTRIRQTQRTTRHSRKNDETMFFSSKFYSVRSQTVMEVTEDEGKQFHNAGRKRKRAKVANGSPTWSDPGQSSSSMDSLAPRTPRGCAVSDLLRPSLEINGLQELTLAPQEEEEELAEWSREGRLQSNSLRFCRVRYLAEDRERMLKELDGFYSSFTLKKEGELYAYMAEMTSGGTSGKEDFAGFHVALLRNSEGQIVSAATFRISVVPGPFGRLAEVPFVATFPNFRRCGYCADLMRGIERCCARLGAHLLILPTVNIRRKSATAQELWWRKHHGFDRFKKMSWQQMKKFLKLYGACEGVGLAGSNVVKFPDCVHLWKEIPPLGGWDCADKVEVITV